VPVVFALTLLELEVQAMASGVDEEKLG